MTPPPYPRIPHLFPPERDVRDDAVLSNQERRAFLASELVVEEKLDGANVQLFRDDSGKLVSTGRAGPDAQDRGRQFGRLRAWLGEHAGGLHGLESGECLYAEWLYRRHSVPYDRLPSLLIVLDCVRGGVFADVTGRDARCAALGLDVPPLVLRGRIRSENDLERLVGRSRFGPELVEGFVLRCEAEGRLLARAKWVRPGFRQKPDDAWSDDVNRARTPETEGAGLPPPQGVQDVHRRS